MIFIVQIDCAQCPVGVDTFHTLTTEAFTYSGVSGLELNIAQISSDNSEIFTSSECKIGGITHSVIIKMDQHFSIGWERAVQGETSPRSMIVSGQELIFAPYRTDRCDIFKLNTSDGAVILQKRFNAATSWRSLQLSSDETYLFVAAIELISPTVARLQKSDLTVVSSFNHTLGASISFLHPFTTGTSNYNVFLGSKSLLGVFHIMSLDTDNLLLPLNWGKQFNDGCLLFCPTVDLPAIAVINQSALIGYMLTTYNNKPLFFSINLSLGSIVGSFYTNNLSEAGMKATDISFNEDMDTIYIFFTHNNGFHLFLYYPSTSTFGQTLKGSTTKLRFMNMMNGYAYYGGQLMSNQYAFIGNIAGEGNHNQNPEINFVSATELFSTVIGYSFINDILLLVVQIASLGTSASTMTFVDPGSYVQSTTNLFSSDVVYQGGLIETYYIKENYIGQVSFSIPWSLSGSTPITHSIIAHPSTGTYPAWVGLNADYEHLDVISPAYSIPFDYYLAVRSVILGENVDKLVTVNVYECAVANWFDCNYTTVHMCDIWDTGFILNTDQLLWYVENAATPDPALSNQTPEDNTNSVDEFEKEDLASILLISQAILGGIVVTSVLNSLLFDSSLEGMWCLFNQYQLTLILPLLKTYMFAKFEYYIYEMEYVDFRFSFINIKNTGTMKWILKVFDYDQSDGDYYKSGFESGSYIVNQSGFFLLLLSVLVLNILFLPVYLYYNLENRGKTARIVRKIAEFLHVSLYLRILFESFVFNLLSATHEAYASSTKIGEHLLSYLIACTNCVLLVILMLMPIILYAVYKNKVSEKKSIKELY
jgi:hypothetical protein